MQINFARSTSRMLKLLFKIHSICKYRGAVMFIESIAKFFIHSPEASVRCGLWKAFCDDSIADAVSLPVSKKFIDNPSCFLGPMAIILRASNSQTKGVLLLKYSYAFPLFLALFNAEKIIQKYHIVLEPSWAGFCDGNILPFANLSSPVFVQTYEPRDRAFIENLHCSLVPVPIGPNWWVDHRLFVARPDSAKDADVCVIASWAKFKRHDEIFKVVSGLRKKGVFLKMVLIGYPVDLQKEDIVELTKRYGIAEQIEIYDRISPAEVSLQLSRCKTNLVWSKREGANRSLIEGFLCGVPGILRKGHNYGYEYEYVNPSTGIFSTPSRLSGDLQYMVNNNERFRPREWVLAHMTCLHAAEVLGSHISSVDGTYGNRVAIKVNALNGMNYFDQAAASSFDEDYQFLLSCLK